MIDLDEDVVVPSLLLDRKTFKNCGWIGPPGIDISNRCSSSRQEEEDGVRRPGPTSSAAPDDDKFEESGVGDGDVDDDDTNNNGNTFATVSDDNCGKNVTCFKFGIIVIVLSIDCGISQQ